MGRFALVATAVLLGATACGTTTALRSVPPQPKFVVYATPSSSPRHTSGHAVGTIWRVHVNGTHAKRITSGNDPAVSPDGRWIAFYRRSRLLVIPAQGGRAKRVFAFSAQDLGYRIAPTWAPDSRHLALRTSYDGFVVVDIRSRAAPLRIATPAVGWGSLVSKPSFSPDSRKILYTETRVGDALCSPPFGCAVWSTVSVVSVRTGKRLHLALPPTGNVEQGEFSPDSSKIAFIAGDNLFVVALRGGKPLRLTTDHASSDPVWGKTGIAFLRHKDIWLTDVAGHHLRQLTHTRAGLQPRLVSASGRVLIASRPSSSSLPHAARVFYAIELAPPLWAVDVTSGRARELTPRGHSIAPLRLSRNGKTLLGIGGCSYGGGEGNVETISLTSGKRRVIARGPCAASWNAG